MKAKILAIGFAIHRTTAVFAWCGIAHHAVTFAKRRMVAVDAEGTIRALPHAPETGEVRLYIDANLSGRRVDNWEGRHSSHKYFAFHFSEASARSQA